MDPSFERVVMAFAQDLRLVVDYGFQHLCRILIPIGNVQSMPQLRTAPERFGIQLAFQLLVQCDRPFELLEAFFWLVDVNVDFSEMVANDGLKLQIVMESIVDLAGRSVERFDQPDARSPAAIRIGHSEHRFGEEGIHAFGSFSLLIGLGQGTFGSRGFARGGGCEIR